MNDERRQELEDIIWELIDINNHNLTSRGESNDDYFINCEDENFIMDAIANWEEPKTVKTKVTSINISLYPYLFVS